MSPAVGAVRDGGTGAAPRAGAEPREGSPGADSRVQADSRAGAAPDPGEERALEVLDGAVGRLGGGPRRGQREMTRRVARAIASGTHLLVQAGTGTGKSLAYLVPAMVHAVDDGERAVVSTATLALQRQILTRDAPLAADAVEALTGRRPVVALLKGWQNYLCRHRVAGGYPDDDDALFAASDAVPRAGAAGLGEQVVRLREWAGRTATGDRDDLVPGVSDRAWAQASVSRAECLGPACPFHDDCFPAAAREAAARADVVVTNHAMLGVVVAGNPGVLPEHDLLVVDEAHALADRVRSQGRRACPPRSWRAWRPPPASTPPPSSPTWRRRGRVCRRRWPPCPTGA